MSATTALLIALTGFFAVIADLTRPEGLLSKSATGIRAWWRRRRPVTQTPAELATAAAATQKAADEAQELVIDGRIVDLKEHVRILKDLVDTATTSAAASSAAAAAATQAAAAAEESAAAARQSARAATTQLQRWHEWAVRWWPVLTPDARRLGVPDPPAMDDALEEHP